MKTKMKLLMALKIWAVIYPSITIFLSVFSAQLEAFPIYVKTLILTVILVPWIVFGGLPLLETIIKKTGNK